MAYRTNAPFEAMKGARNAADSALDFLFSAANLPRTLHADILHETAVSLHKAAADLDRMVLEDRQAIQAEDIAAREQPPSPPSQI